MTDPSAVDDSVSTKQQITQVMQARSLPKALHVLRAAADPEP